MEDAAYLALLRERAKKSRVYVKYQLTGLLIAQLLGDETHKSLYIKLAKIHDEEKLMQLAKDIAERKQVRNKGAYFMRMLALRAPRITQKIKTRKKNI